jgi:hypothetical protein
MEEKNISFEEQAQKLMIEGTAEYREKTEDPRFLAFVARCPAASDGGNGDVELVTLEDNATEELVFTLVWHMLRSSPAAMEMVAKMATEAVAKAIAIEAAAEAEGTMQ